MANSFVELPVSGSSTYTFPFPYLDSAHISVFVGGVLQTVDTHYTYTSSNVIEFTAGNVPTDTSQVIRITRATAPTGRLVGFSNTGLDADDLNLDSDQIFYMAQEAVDTVETSVFRGVDGTLDVNGRLTNVADPIDDLDAANKQYVASQVAAGSGSVTVDAVAPSSPSQGDLWIDTSSNVMYVWTGTQWVNGGIQESARYDFLGSDGFPISTRLLFGGSLYGSNLSAVSEVYLNGILLKPTTSILDFTTGDYDILDSTGLSISPAPSASDEITVITSSALSSSLVTAINTVNSNSTGITTVASNITDVNDVAANMADVTGAVTQAQNAASSASTAFASADLSIAAKVASENARDDSQAAKADAETAQVSAEAAQAAAEAAESSINTDLSGKADLSGATFTGDVDATGFSVSGVDVALSTDIPDVSSFITSSALSPYALTTDIPDVSGKADLSGATFTGDVYLANDMRLRFKEADGTSGLEIYTATDGTVWINEGGDANFNISGDDLRVRSDDLTLRNRGGSNNYFKGVDGGAVQVYHGDGTERIDTTATGIDVTGDIDVTGTVTADGVVTAVNTFNQSTVSSIDTLSIPSGSTLVMTGGSASGGISTDNGAGSYPVGYSMTIINQSTDDKLVNQTGSDVLTLCGQAGVSTGNLTLGSGGVASLIKTAANAWTIFGSNLS